MKFFTLVFDTIATAQKNVLRNKIRSVLTILAIFIGALTLSLTNGAASGFSSYINSLLSSVATGENIYFVTKDFNFGGEGTPGSDIQPYNPNREESTDGDFAPLTPSDVEYLSSLDQVASITESYFAQANYVRRETLDQAWQIKEVKKTSTSLVAMLGFSYDIRVRAKNSEGTGAWSGPVSTQAFVVSEDIPQEQPTTNTNLPAPPNVFVATDEERALGNDQGQYAYKIEWDAVEGADAYDITYKKVVTYNQIDITQYFDGLEFELTEGKLIDNESPEYTIILPKRYHEALGFGTPQDAIGKEVVLGFQNQTGESREFTAQVVGTTPNTFIQGGMVNISEAFIRDAQKFQTGTDQIYFSLTLTLDPDMTQQEIATFKEQLEEKEYQVRSWQDIVGTINDVMNGIRWGLNVFGIITLLAAGFGIINTLFMGVYERTREIGLMRAVGMSKLRIFSLFAIEATLLGLWGSLLGIVVGMLLGRLLLNGLAQDLLGNLEKFDLFIFPIFWLAFIIFGIMLLAFIASIIPAIKASRLNPIDALRHE